MAGTNRVFVDGLESRRLLSFGHHFEFGGGHHIPQPPSPVVQADLDKIQADKTALHTTLAADEQAEKDAFAALAPTLDPLKQKLADDKTALAPTLQADRDAIKAIYTADLPAIKTDWQALWTAKKSGDQTAIDAAQAQLDADKQKLTDDVTPAKDQLKADFQPIADDIKAIHDAIANDPGVQAAETQEQADLAAGHATLAADYTQLWTDIKNNA